MPSITKTIARNTPTGRYIEVTAELRDGTEGLSPGFAISGMIWERHGTESGRTRKRRGRDCDAAGQIVDEILHHFPKLAPIVHVHLASPDGVPMHAKANGWYFYSGGASKYEREMVASGRDYGYSRNLERSDHERAASALRIPTANLPEGMDKEQFEAFVDSLAERYAADAAAARRVLDDMVDGDGVEEER